jgi:hypothetical protein
MAMRSMRNKQTVVIHEDAHATIVAVRDPASGHRGRYTVHRISRWADKRTDVVGRELPLAQARKIR